MENKIIDKLAGDFEKNPTDVVLGGEAKELIQKAYEGVPDGIIFDYHAHMLGFGTSGSGIWVNPEMDSFLHPEDKTKLHVYISASGIEDREKADEQYLQRFLNLIGDLPYPSKTFVLALDKSYNTDGTENLNNTKAYVPNEYVMQVCQQNPRVFSPCISVHPYRKDALEELEKWANRGVRMVKWIPNEMAIDASSRACESFFEKMVELDMVLLTHTGDEDALKVVGLQHLGNPLLFIKPLDMGVKIIMAHCAGLGTNQAFDREDKPMEKNYKLFLRLMEEPRYVGQLWGDISGLVQINRSGEPLKAILERQDIHHRLINGTDYPLPAINSVVSTKALAQMGYLEQEHVAPLNEIYSRNPLLFDFVLKRTLHHPDDKTLQFNPLIFGEQDALSYLNEAVAGSI
ncbi:amidohydrolase family protein [Pontibacter brevis]